MQTKQPQLGEVSNLPDTNSAAHNPLSEMSIMEQFMRQTQAVGPPQNFQEPYLQ